MCGINYFQLLKCLLYHITAYYTPGSLLAVAVTYTNTKNNLKTSKNYMTLPSTSHQPITQSPDILCMLRQMHIFMIYLLYIFLFILPLEILKHRMSHVEDVNVRQPLKLATMDRHRSGQPINNCGMTAL